MGPHKKTVDLQHLNAQGVCETHYTQSPFQAASSVPPNTWKTILDAFDGYHVIILDRKSQPLTTFIIEWCRYLRLPQGYLASGDVYTRRFNEFIRGMPKNQNSR